MFSESCLSSLCRFHLDILHLNLIFDAKCQHQALQLIISFSFQNLFFHIFHIYLRKKCVFLFQFLLNVRTNREFMQTKWSAKKQMKQKEMRRCRNEWRDMCFSFWNHAIFSSFLLKIIKIKRNMKTNAKEEELFERFSD